MPEISDSEFRDFVRYQNLGTPAEILKRQEDLVTDNGKQRDEIRDLKAKMPEGSVVVPQADAEYITILKPLGKASDIKSKLKQGDDVQKRLAELETRTAAEKFAKVVGLAEESVDTLIAIPALAQAKFEVKKGKVKDKGGNEVDGDVGYLTLSGENQSPMTFADALEKVPALKGLRMVDPSSREKPGVTFVQQGGGSDGSPGTVFDEIRNEMKQKKEDPASGTAKAKPLEERLHLSPM